jgi:hypothetical protein
VRNKRYDGLFDRKFLLKYILYKLNIVSSHNIKTMCNILQRTMFNINIIITIIIIATGTNPLLPGQPVCAATSVSTAIAKLPCKHDVTTAGVPQLWCPKYLLRKIFFIYVMPIFNLLHRGAISKCGRSTELEGRSHPAMTLRLNPRVGYTGRKVNLSLQCGIDHSATVSSVDARW